MEEQSRTRAGPVGGAVHGAQAARRSRIAALRRRIRAQSPPRERQIEAVEVAEPARRDCRASRNGGIGSRWHVAKRLAQFRLIIAGLAALRVRCTWHDLPVASPRRNTSQSRERVSRATCLTPIQSHYDSDRRLRHGEPAERTESLRAALRSGRNLHTSREF